MAHHFSHKCGTLYIAATPIGNLGDMTSRLIDILKSVDLIACEDTRHTRKLLSHLGISNVLTSYYRENEHHKSDQLIEKLLEGTTIAVVSDAGTPGLSDPGAILVSKARKVNISIIPIPGPSALATALSVSGLTQPQFCFGGFLPAKRSERRKALLSFKTLPCPIFFYESPHRIAKTLADCLKILGNRHVQIFRELTKIHEQHIAGSISDVLDQVKQGVRGELVFVIDGHHNRSPDRPLNLNELILWYRDTGNYSLKDAVKIISSDLDLSRSKVYQQALSLWNT